MKPADTKRTMEAVTVDATEVGLLLTPATVLMPTPAIAPADCEREGGAEIQAGGLSSLSSLQLLAPLHTWVFETH